MKKTNYLLVAIMLLTFFSCKKDECTDCIDNIPFKGAPVALRVNMLGVDSRGNYFKAIEDPNNPSEDQEIVIHNHTLFVFNEEGNLTISPLYVDKGEASADVVVPSTSTEIYIVANGGDPKVNTSFLYKALAASTGANYKSRLLSAETALEDHVVGGLIRTGASAIEIETDEDGVLYADVTVGLKFVAAKVVVDFMMDVDANSNLKGALLKNIHMLNVRGESRIFSATLEGNGNASTSVARTWGTIYDTKTVSYRHGKLVTDIVPGNKYIATGTQTDLLINNYANGIHQPTLGGTNDYFYALENKSGNIDPNANSLLVFEVLYANTTDIEEAFRGQTRYYTVNFDGKTGYINPPGLTQLDPDMYKDYSIRRGVRYTITATLKSNGTDNPLTKDARLDYKIEAEDWIRTEGNELDL